MAITISVLVDPLPLRRVASAARQANLFANAFDRSPDTLDGHSPILKTLNPLYLRQFVPDRELNAAYAMENYDAAKQALNGLHRELMDLNPSAARSLAEGLEETLT